MAWQERLRQAAYTPQGGERFTFDYENVGRELDKKTAAFNFVDADGTFVQDNGTTGQRIPVRMFFSGGNHDLTADALIDAITGSRGPGVLEHPRYGRISVVPFGKISQRDDLKTAANQTIIDITFFETTGLIYPSALSDPSSGVLSAVDAFNVSIADAFNTLVDLSTAFNAAVFKNDFVSLVGGVTSALGAVANEVDAVRVQFNTIADSITQGIDVLATDLTTLAAQTTQLVQSPARSSAPVADRLAAFGTLSNVITSGTQELTPNAYNTQDLYAMAYVSGSVVSVVNNQFSTKTDALSAAAVILDQLGSVVIWRDARSAEIGQIDTGEAYQKLQEAVALAAGFLVEISFSLKQERSIVLDRERTIIDLTAELYGTVDDKLDFLINSNNLSGSEILEMQRGREIVYYI